MSLLRGIGAGGQRNDRLAPLAEVGLRPGSGHSEHFTPRRGTQSPPPSPPFKVRDHRDLVCRILELCHSTGMSEPARVEPEVEALLRCLGLIEKP